MPGAKRAVWREMVNLAAIGRPHIAGAIHANASGSALGRIVKQDVSIGIKLDDAAGDGVPVDVVGAGTGAKDITGKAIVQMLAAGGNSKQVMINAKVADLDTEGNFAFVALSVTVGAAATLLGAILIGAYPRYEDGALFNQAGVTQVI